MFDQSIKYIIVDMGADSTLITVKGEKPDGAFRYPTLGELRVPTTSLCAMIAQLLPDSNRWEDAITWLRNAEVKP